MKRNVSFMLHILWFLFFFEKSESSLRCMSCTNMPLPRVCETVTTCAVGEICYVQAITVSGHTLYNSGCKPTAQCQAPNIVGKRDVGLRAAANLECCQTDFCNKEGFGFVDIPKSLRGPHCFSGSYAVDVTTTSHLITCRKGEVCTIEPATFTGVADIFYNQKCVERSSCSTVHQHTGCDGSCCDQDYCNDRCVHYTTPAPTLNPNDLLKAECFRHINDGFFFDSYTNLCVLMVKSPAMYSQAQAQQICKSKNSDLMTITSQDEQDFLLSWIFSHQANDTDFWIGAQTKVSKSHDYFWPTGDPASGGGVYNHWSGIMMGQPDDRRTKNENCVFLNDKDRYFWHDDQCSERKTGYICEIWNVTGSKVPVCRGHVFDGFFYDADNDMCLKLHETRIPQFTHAQAEVQCQQFGATLAIIDSDKKMDFVLKWIFSNHENATDFWIGAQDIHDTSEFYWPNGQKLVYTHWGGPVFPPEPHGQPDAAYGAMDQRCVYMDYINNYFWFDENCSARKTGFVCQYSGADHDSTKNECRHRLTQGYFYDDYTNLCISLKTRQNATYNVAKAVCMRENSKLAVIDSADKTNFVLSWIFFQKINDTDYWIGGVDPHGNNNFIWEPTGSRFTYTHWYTIIPPRPEDCTVLDHIDVYRWKPADCDSKTHGYICQINQHSMATTLPTPPTTTTTTTTTKATTPSTTTTHRQTTHKVCHRKSADVVFILDSSGSESTSVFAQTKTVAAEVADLLFTNTFDVRFAALTFSTAVKLEFWLNSYNNKHAVINAIHSIQYHAGSTHTDLALYFTRTNVLTSPHGARNESEKIVIVFTDGASSNPSATQREAQLIHQTAKVVAVAVGDRATQFINDLNQIAPSKDLVVSANAVSIYMHVSAILSPTSC